MLLFCILRSTNWLAWADGFREKALEDSQSDFRIPTTRQIQDGMWTRAFRPINQPPCPDRISIGALICDLRDEHCSCCFYFLTLARTTHRHGFAWDRICEFHRYWLQLEKTAWG